MYARIFEATQVDLTHRHLQPDVLTGVYIFSLYNLSVKIGLYMMGLRRANRGNEIIENFIEEIHSVLGLKCYSGFSS